MIISIIILIIVIIIILFALAMLFFSEDSVPPDMLYPYPWNNEGSDNKMISAKEARNQSEQYFKSELDKEIEMIEQKILYATTQGKNFVCIEPAISTSAKQMLKQLGYKVEHGQQYNESYTNIGW